MDSNQMEKGLKNGCMVDRISNLPDSILGKIVSFLPTKNAAATCILSTRWKRIFPFEVQPLNIRLDDSSSLKPTQNESDDTTWSNSFMDFVDRLLGETLCGDDVLRVEGLELKCEKHYGDVRITSWVSSAFVLDVQNLVLKSFLDDSMNTFNCINRCTSLVRLHLGKNFDLCLPGNFVLPNLKTLLLDHLTFLGERESIHELLDGCPVLEDLGFYYCDWQLLLTLRIQSPLLKGLYIEECRYQTTCNLMLNAPNLERLSYAGYGVCNLVLTKFKSLIDAHFDVGPSSEQLKEAEIENNGGHLYFDNCVARLVAASFSTMYLYLSDLSIASLQRSAYALPRFQNLTFLALGCIGINGWKLLGCLLQTAPNLENLNIEEGFEEYKGGYTRFESSLLGVPNCLETHLKKIEFWIFKGAADEVKLIEYFLKHGKLLQQIKVHCLPFEDISILIRLLMFPSQSNTCQVKFEREMRN